MGDSYYSFAEILDRPYTHILQFQRAIRESPLRHIALLRSIPSFKASAKKNRDGEVAIPILFVMESIYGYQLPISEKIGILYVLLV